MNVLTLPEIRAKAERALFPALPDTHPRSALPGSRKGVLRGTTSDELLELHAQHASWRRVATALHCSHDAILKRAKALGINTSARSPRHRSDAEVLKAFAMAGTAKGTAMLLGMSPGGAFTARLNRLRGLSW